MFLWFFFLVQNKCHWHVCLEQCVCLVSKQNNCGLMNPSTNQCSGCFQGSPRPIDDFALQSQQPLLKTPEPPYFLLLMLNVKFRRSFVPQCCHIVTGWLLPGCLHEEPLEHLALIRPRLDVQIETRWQKFTNFVQVTKMVNGVYWGKNRPFVFKLCSFFLSFVSIVHFGKKINAFCLRTASESWRHAGIVKQCTNDRLTISPVGAKRPGDLS